ncbi:hypothetical protein SEA_OCTOBIEN14_29 [Gordonia phage Octobien14]|uniref:Minor tail protein n=1 Tax=Gordonia phage Octobien14 TaxID=2483673 RepID=A0A3G3MAL9_9CAUD|nr:hypothetical protein L3Y22_gp029 [Gordonia phage Octobien14]AYR03177.1 hypothetical protein SEA_OCTOBIEN14_29 [Gordonia phage Octobien14]
MIVLSEQARRFESEVTDWDDPTQHLAPFLYEWPAFGKMQAMPAPTALVPYQAELLYKMGVRFHPELAEVVKVSDADGVSQWVSKAEAEALAEAESERLGSDEALGLLAKISPDRAAEIESMSDEERAAQADAMAPDLAEALNELARLRKALEVANAGA